jgi:capsular polysaccharide biosynthesis protein
LGIPKTRVIEISQSDVIKAKQILFISHTPCGSPQPSRLIQLRNMFLNNIQSIIDEIGIVIVRHHSRSIINHNELMHNLKNSYPKIQWIEFTGKQTAEQTIDLWLKAKYVIAPHGVGLSNLLFCTPGVKVIEILPSEDLNFLYGSIAEALNHQWTGIIVKSSNNYNMIAPIKDIIDLINTN